MGRKKSLVITDVRLINLDRALDDHDPPLSRRDLARGIGVKEDRVGGWYKQDILPEREEEKIEQFLQLPPGFFRKISQGVSYADAKDKDADQRRKDKETLDKAVKAFAFIFGHNAQLPKQWEHIANQLVMIAEMVRDANPNLDYTKPLPPKVAVAMLDAMQKLSQNIKDGIVNGNGENGNILTTL